MFENTLTWEIVLEPGANATLFARACPRRARRRTTLLPAQRATGLVFDHASFKKVAFLLKIDHLRHPREGILFLRVQRFDTDLLATTVGDEAQVGFEHGSVQAQHTTRHRVFGVSVFEFDRFAEEFSNFFAKFRRPQMRIFQFDGVDQVDAEIAVHGFIAQDVHVLLGRAGHLVLATERQDLREANVEEQAFHQASEDDQRLQQRLVGFGRARLEVGIRDRVDERDQELVLGGWTALRCKR